MRRLLVVSALLLAGCNPILTPPPAPTDQATPPPAAPAVQATYEPLAAILARGETARNCLVYEDGQPGLLQVAASSPCPTPAPTPMGGTAAVAPTSAPGSPPLTIRCIVTSPTPALLLVSASTPGTQLIAGAKSFCDSLVGNGQGWTAQPLDRPTQGYASICTAIMVNQGFSLGVYALKDERSQGLTYDWCAQANATYSIKP